MLSEESGLSILEKRDLGWECALHKAAETAIGALRLGREGRGGDPWDCELGISMEYLIDPSEIKEEEGQSSLEIDPGLLLRKDHLSWLFPLINSIPINSVDQSVNFCICCRLYLAQDEQTANHRHPNPSQGAHHLFPLILVQCRDNYMGGGAYYVSVQALRELQVPIGDVLSQVLPHPHPRLMRANAAANDLARCIYVYPQNSKEIWQGETWSGRCAFRDCERIFNNRQSHLRLYGITPQFCSISCKIRSWIACNT